MNIEQLKGYIKRKLGYPVINIEIDDTQLSDAITESFEMFSEFHSSGVDVGYIFLDIESKVSEYILDSSVYEVLAVLSSDFNYYGDNDTLLIDPYLFGYNHESSGLVDYEVFRQNIKNIKNILGKEMQYEFNPVTKKLILFEIPEKNIKIAIKIYKGHNQSEIYNDSWFKKYCVALAGIQWANNLTKYRGGKLPGNLEFNGDEIYSRYYQIKENLEEELHDRFEEPPDSFVG